MTGSNGIFRNIWVSVELVLANKISWLLLCGPIALLGDALGFLGEATCFALSGIALIPCAERLSFVTEQVAEHTNGTIGALLNATFGNAPELLIATAALRSGYYRVVQLAMLGSMLTNLLFVFGLACLIGGLRWQVQELRITSGNVNVLLLLLSVAGSILPAALILAGQIQGGEQTNGLPSDEELKMSRVNAFVMIFMYACFLIFQLGTHKDEFEDDDNTVVTSSSGRQTPHMTFLQERRDKNRNIFCLKVLHKLQRRNNAYITTSTLDGGGDVELQNQPSPLRNNDDAFVDEIDQNSNADSDSSEDSTANKLLPQNETSSSSYANGYFDDYKNTGSPQRRSPKNGKGKANGYKKNTDFKPMLPLGLADPSEEPFPPSPVVHAPQMSFCTGIFLLFVITIGISALSDILVDTIDGFADKFEISEVFTSMVIVPFFSNVAEQVSAVLFAYRNEMDLCVGVTVGSAIQVATFVLPGCVLIGMIIDRSMTLYFHAYETVCLLLAVISVAAVLQGGTTNWLVGTTMIGIYVMIATGFWFHALEDLSTDEEIVDSNTTTNNGGM